MAWWFFFFPIGGLIFIILVVLVTWLFFSSRGTWMNRSYPPQVDTALQLLRERYAKSEITKEQFEQMSKDLGHH